MALWKDPPARVPTQGGNPPSGAAATEPKAPTAGAAPDNDATRLMPGAGGAPKAGEGETVIAAGLTMEGKIASGGNVRIAGRFKGDVSVDGNFRIDSGGHLEGQVTASSVIIGGEFQGNIESAKHVDVLASGVIVGDVKAASITVAAGSRMRGHVEFGWEK